MLNNQVNLIIKLLPEDTAGLSILTDAVSEMQVTLFCEHPSEGAQVSIGFKSINDIVSLRNSGHLAVVRYNPQTLMLHIGNNDLVVGDITLMVGGLLQDMVLLAPTNIIAFRALASLHGLICEHETRERGDNRHISRRRETVLGFMDLTKVRHSARSVNSVFGDSSRKAFDQSLTNPRYDRSASIHHPSTGVSIEVHGHEIRLHVDGELTLRTGIDQIDNDTWVNNFRSELLVSVSDDEIKEALSEYDNIKLVEHTGEKVAILVDTKSLCYDISDVKKNLSLLRYTLEEKHNGLITNVKVDPKESGPGKAHVSEQILALGNKSRKDVGSVTYQYTGSGIMLNFLNVDDRDSWIAVVESKLNPNKAKQTGDILALAATMDSDNKYAPTYHFLVDNKPIIVKPSNVSEDGEYIMYSYRDDFFKSVETKELQRLVTGITDVGHSWRSSNPETGDLVVYLPKKNLPIEIEIKDNKLYYNDEHLPVVTQWNNSFSIDLPESLAKVYPCAIRHGLAKVLKVSIMDAFEVYSEQNDNKTRLNLLLGKGNTNSVAKKILMQLYQATEDETSTAE